MLLRASPWLFALLLSACAVQPPAPTSHACACPCLPVPGQPPALIPTPAAAYPTLKPVNWSAVTFWQEDAVSEAWAAFMRSCSTLVKRTAWQAVCAEAAGMTAPSDAAVRTFFEQRFQPYQSTQEDGSSEGLVTGYYEPLLKGDRGAHGARALPDLCGTR